MARMPPPSSPQSLNEFISYLLPVLVENPSASGTVESFIHGSSCTCVCGATGGHPPGFSRWNWTLAYVVHRLGYAVPQILRLQSGAKQTGLFQWPAVEEP